MLTRVLPASTNTTLAMHQARCPGHTEGPNQTPQPLTGWDANSST